MTWMRVDLSGPDNDELDPGSARARRLKLRELLLRAEGLSGQEALLLARELRQLELAEAALSLR